MAYAAKMDMVLAFGQVEMVQITDIEEPYTNAINDARLSAALDEAASAADGYLRGRYRLPISPVPTDLRRRVCDIARFLLHDDGTPETVKDRYDRAMKWLHDIADGKVTLDAPAATAAESPTTSGAVLVSASPRVFGMEDGR
ncbi:gp436 family protein [Rhodospirillum sp. A1_3_36]|uniref:gp436 family protein n=1 Tax=Rhodospirillum sp. A1_3_36 TaxID=3391666 RepID=UPI0039A6CC87